jgi:hypothetical protein
LRARYVVNGPDLPLCRPSSNEEWLLAMEQCLLRVTGPFSLLERGAGCCCDTSLLVVTGSAAIADGRHVGGEPETLERSFLCHGPSRREVEVVRGGRDGGKEE